MRFKLYREVDESKIPDIINRNLFKVKCEECGEEAILDYSLVLYAENYLIYYKVNEDKIEIKEDKKIKRICTNFNDFKEKLLIFNDGLNDIVVEFVKELLFRSLDEETKKQVREIRLDNAQGDKLVFYLIGAKKYLAVDKEGYEKVLNKLDQTKDTELIEVNKDTYFKYYGMMKK